MMTSKFLRLLILAILAAILVAGFLFIQTPLFTKLAALANQNLIIEPIEEPSGYYSVDSSKVWPLGILKRLNRILIEQWLKRF